MQNAAGSGFGFEHHDHNDTHQAVVTELVGLIEDGLSAYAASPPAFSIVGA